MASLATLHYQATAEGRILMNSPFSGAGSYTHVKGGELLYGSWGIHAQDDRTLIVAHKYGKAETATETTLGECWVRIEQN